jgi:cytochrome P450/nitrite reductase/ring-hydroxylating ferredoxin subunit
MTIGHVAGSTSEHGSSAEQWRKAAKVSDVRAERPTAAVVDGTELVLVRRGDTLRAYDARCPHQGTLLTEGEIRGQDLVCRGHGYRFDVVTGECKERGKNLCLRSYPTKTDGGDVLVKLGTKRALPPLLDLSRARRQLSDLPGPAGWPVFGNALSIELERMHLRLEHWASLYGSPYKLSVMGKPVIVVSDPELAEQLLRARPVSLRRTSSLEQIFHEMGTAGVFSAEGEAWRAQRKLTMQALSNRHVRNFFPTLRRVALALHERWAEHAASNVEADIDDDLMRFTVDVTTNLVFSTDLKTVESGESELHGHLARVFPAFVRRLMAAVPYWRFVRLPSDRVLDDSLAEVRKFQEQLVNDTRARLAERAPDDTEPHDFIEAMLLARDDDGKPFADEVVYGNMMTMLLAGEDTTAHTLAWAVNFLCDHPNVVARMRAEADALLGSEVTPADFENAQNFPYIDAVANETMRLKPVAPFMGLEANEDIVIGDVLVPKGTWINVITRLPAVSEQYFYDAHSFKPERWLEAKPGATHVPGASMPFGSGPRICPGRSLALLEMRIVLATLVKSFDVTRIGSESSVRERFAFTMSPRGLRVRLSPRRAIS